jgi:hypothetical protein
VGRVPRDVITWRHVFRVQEWKPVEAPSQRLGKRSFMCVQEQARLCRLKRELDKGSLRLQRTAAAGPVSNQLLEVC